MSDKRQEILDSWEPRLAELREQDPALAQRLVLDLATESMLKSVVPHARGTAAEGVSISQWISRRIEVA